MRPLHAARPSSAAAADVGESSSGRSSISTTMSVQDDDANVSGNGGGASETAATISSSGDHQAAEAESEASLVRICGSQPDTQPLTEEIGAVGVKHPTVWAHLISSNKRFLTVDIAGRSQFKWGRHKTCDYVVRPSDSKNIGQLTAEEVAELSPEKWMQWELSFSAVQFLIWRSDDEQDVFIQDESLNGTFVNGDLVGKGKRRPLVDRDKIQLRTTDQPHLEFVLASAPTGESADEDSVRNRPVCAAELPTELRRKYIVRQFLGEGAASKVYLAYAKERDYEKVAVKVISKQTLTATAGKDYQLPENMAAEAKIMAQVDHPCILRVFEVIIAESAVIIVVEYARGGELFDFVLRDFKLRTFDERIAKLQCFQLFSALSYLHSRPVPVCHRDLKLENVLLARKGKTALLKIADFGLSRLVDRAMTTYVGTPEYVAPEVLMNKNAKRHKAAYSVKVDCWSLGCIMYSLICGSPAFGNTSDQLASRIRRADYRFDFGVWLTTSDQAKDLIGKLLTVNPTQRISASAGLSHPWFDDADVRREAEKLMRGEVDFGFAASTTSEVRPPAPPTTTAATATATHMADGKEGQTVAAVPPPPSSPTEPLTSSPTEPLTSSPTEPLTTSPTEPPDESSASAPSSPILLSRSSKRPSEIVFKTKDEDEAMDTEDIDEERPKRRRNL